ncbi:hypothetical protein CJI97_004535 [Candidozyma auris]|nr:hypothetical protein CJI97_004535 [[Candida] auris]
MFVLPLAALVASALAADNPWATYPSVPKTASINGFADPIFDSLPSCAQPCVKQSVSSTPCPYWDTGCLCVMTTWSSSVTECFAKNCKGDDAQKALDTSVNICKKVGVWEPYWIINAQASAAIESAIKEQATTQQETTSSKPETTSTSAPAETTQETTATTGAPTSATSSQVEQTSAPAASSPKETSAAASSAAASSAAASAPAVSSFEGAGAGAKAGVAVGLAAGVAMLL